MSVSRISWSWDAWSDYTNYWHEPQNEKTRARLDTMLEELRRNPKSRGYKAEPLKYDLSGWNSMRITQSERLVYRLNGDALEILSCRYHYK